MTFAICSLERLANARLSTVERKLRRAMSIKTLRKRGMQTPILILTAKDAVEDRVLGLDSRADDYLAKPFAFQNCWPVFGRSCAAD